MTKAPAVRALLAATAAAVALASALAGDDDAARARFKKEMDAVYDYLPYDVEQAVRDAKVKAMDGFWEFVAADLATNLPLLREALKDQMSNRYFLYDGSGLLVEHSKEAADVQLAADATARCRMKDVGRGYFWFCHHLAKLGADAMPAILQLLDDPKYSVPLTRHSMTLHQEQCMRLCVLVTGEERSVPPLLKRLETEREPTAVATLLRCLADAVTPEADAVIRRLDEDESADPALRAAAKKVRSRTVSPAAASGAASLTRDDFAAWLKKAEEKGRLPTDAMSPGKLRDARLLVEAADVPVLRSLRRKTAGRVSDEALSEIDFLTELLRRATAEPK